MEVLSITEAIDRIHVWLENRGRSLNTVKSYKADVRMFFIEMNLVEIKLVELDALAARWLNWCRRDAKPAMSAKTIQRRATSMRVFAKSLGLVILADYNGPTPARPIPHPLPGGTNDIMLMLNCARNDDQRALIALTGLCGCRVGEALSVGPDSVDIQRMALTIKGKGDRERIVPVSKLAWDNLAPAIIKARITSQQRLLQYADRSARETITRLAARAGVGSEVSSHDMRATFATAVYRLTKDIRVVQDLLGHASSKQTEIYIGVRFDDLQAAVEIQATEDDDD